MSVLEQIIQSVSAMSSADQANVLKAVEWIRGRESRLADAALEQWSVKASKNAFSDLPANEWDDVYREWIARHPEADEAR